MSRDDNVTVFKDTEHLCKTNARPIGSVKKATAAQKLILERDALPEQYRDYAPHDVRVARDPFF